MPNSNTKNLLEEHLKVLANAAKDSTRSGEELKAITEAIETNISLLKSFDFVPCDSNGCHSSKGELIMNPLTEN